MSTSSSAQLELEYSDSKPLSGDDRIASKRDQPEASVFDTPDTTSASLKIPDFGSLNKVYAATSRLAGRVNAANISDDEHKSLLHERQALLDKKLGDTITREETNRLEYVRWSLDRVEDAKFGHELDVLEGHVSAYEGFLNELRVFEEQLQQSLQINRK